MPRDNNYNHMPVIKFKLLETAKPVFMSFISYPKQSIADYICRGSNINIHSRDLHFYIMHVCRDITVLYIYWNKRFPKKLNCF